MQRIRITIRHNPDDPVEDLRLAAHLQRDLWAHSPVEIDPGSPRHGTHRDDRRNAFFEFATEFPGEVERVLREYGYADRSTLEVVAEGDGAECVNCGNIPPQAIATCPNCGFRDIDSCPYCDSEIARLVYVPIAGDLFRCPHCGRRVRLSFQDPPFDPSGRYNQPLVLVSPSEAPVAT